MQSASVLIIDDEPTLRTLLGRIIELEGYTVHQAQDGKSALRILEREVIHLVISDVKLPDINGIELVAKIKKLQPYIEIIVLTAFGSIENGVQAMKNGAFDYLTKGDHTTKVLPLLATAAEKALLQHRVHTLENKLVEKFGFERVIGTSAALRQVIDLGVKVAATDATVLLTGQTGTGKEVFAQAIHFHSGRKTKAFVAVNCSALGKDILESELFGYKAGAFTGASRDKKGLFDEAKDGTIFLDEVGEMTLDLQAKLLRVLETGSFIPVGDTRESKVNIRIIAATNREFQEEIKKGNFREDLFYRLSAFEIHLPTLNERTDDIESLAKHFITYFADKVNKKVTGMNPEFLGLLKQHFWRGNIRELKNTIERSIIVTSTEELCPEDLPMDFNYKLRSQINESQFSLELVEREHIRHVLQYAKGNKTHTAKLLNIGLTTLYQKIKDYGIS